MTTPEEDTKIIRALRRLERMWPKDRQLLSVSGTLLYVRTVRPEDVSPDEPYTLEDAVIADVSRIISDGGAPDMDADIDSHGDMSQTKKEFPGYYE